MQDNIFPLRVYTFVDAQRHHNGYDVVNSEEELAQKIVANQQDKLVTDFMDLPVFDTFGSFVNFVYDNREHYGSDAPNYKPWFFNKFQPILLKAQGFGYKYTNKIYNMAIYYNKKVIYELEVEAESVEAAREIIWDNFIDVAYADEQPHPCGDCAYYGDCKCNLKECEYSEDYEGGE